IYALKLALLLIASLCIAAYCSGGVRYAELQSALLWMLVMLPGLALQPSWFFNGTERMAALVRSEFAARSLFLLAALILIDAPSDLGLFFCVHGLASLLSAGRGGLLLCKTGDRMHRPTYAACLQTLREARPVSLSRAA